MFWVNSTIGVRRIAANRDRNDGTVSRGTGSGRSGNLGVKELELPCIISGLDDGQYKECTAQGSRSRSKDRLSERPQTTRSARNRRPRLDALFLEAAVQALRSDGVSRPEAVIRAASNRWPQVATGMARHRKN
jgi:hypothetical protein